MKHFFLLLTSLLIGLQGVAAESASENLHSVVGVVRDMESRTVLENVHISAVGTSIGTVSNADGLFVLKLSEAQLQNGLLFAHLGYRNTHLTWREIARGDALLTIWMIPSTVEVQQVNIYGSDPRRLVESAIERIASNYAPDDHLFSAFYRETVQKRRRYISVSEAVLDVYKSDYEVRNPFRDRAQLKRGRRLVSQRRRDTLAVKMAGGPAMPVFLDAVKNGEDLLSAENLHYYDFRMERPVMLNNRMQHVVSFRPQVVLDYALYIGKLYIDQESLAITRAEYELDLSNREKAVERVLQRRPLGLRFRPQRISFLVTYKPEGDRYYLNYLRYDVRFRCDWRRRSFAASYTTTSEMVMVDRSLPTAPIRARDSYRQGAIFYDMVDAYWDADYWRDYNIIEPTESLETAVDRLRKQ